MARRCSPNRGPRPPGRPRQRAGGVGAPRAPRRRPRRAARPGGARRPPSRARSPPPGGRRSSGAPPRGAPPVRAWAPARPAAAPGAAGRRGGWGAVSPIAGQYDGPGPGGHDGPFIRALPSVRQAPRSLLLLTASVREPRALAGETAVVLLEAAGHVGAAGTERGAFGGRGRTSLGLSRATGTPPPGPGGRHNGVPFAPTWPRRRDARPTQRHRTAGHRRRSAPKTRPPWPRGRPGRLRAVRGASGLLGGVALSPGSARRARGRARSARGCAVLGSKVP